MKLGRLVMCGLGVIMQSTLVQPARAQLAVTPPTVAPPAREPPPPPPRTPAQTAPAQTAVSITLHGRVVADDTGDPIANARVAAPAGAIGTPVVLTDDEGRFALTVSSELANVVVSKPGFGRREIARAALSQRTDIRLQRGAVISGRVVDELGDPVQSARVGVHAPADADTRPALVVVETDDRGEYRLASLAAGTYVVSASSFGPMRTERIGPTAMTSSPLLLRIFYPDTQTAADAQQLRLEPGDERSGVDFVIAGAQSMGPFN